jgi:DNA-binding NarL/FixJ family response regulator
VERRRLRKDKKEWFRFLDHRNGREGGGNVDDWRSTRGVNHLTATRVLVVDDFAPFREFVSLTLAERPELVVIGEASDGPEALEKAVGLRPDLILLDLNLPKMNGMEVARRFRELVPESRIIFFSQESSVDLVEEARRMGVWGYVVKAEARSQLLPTVYAVMSGKQSFGS